MHFADLAVVATRKGLADFGVAEFRAPKWHRDAARLEFWIVKSLNVQGSTERRAGRWQGDGADIAIVGIYRTRAMTAITTATATREPMMYLFAENHDSPEF